MTTAKVLLWGKEIGAVSWDKQREYAYFEYTSEFQSSGIQISPLQMPLSSTIYSFPALAPATFHGLPGLLADSLPDKFGNALIDVWLATTGREKDSFNSVERLCYIGNRGMGALEFEPAISRFSTRSQKLDVAELVKLASEILTQRTNFRIPLDIAGSKAEAIESILRVGTSAGGARAKALIAWNQVTNEIRSGQIAAGSGFSYWLFKFDGVSNNRDHELADPLGFGVIEYSYYLMAQEAQINMTQCRVFQESNRHHFMTERFDREPDGSKIHLQSLTGLAHFDFNQSAAYSYEQALQVMTRLGLGAEALLQQFRRICFNIVARNQDDHVKNIAFLMDRTGSWTLAPAFDITYSFNPKGDWTSKHQMSMNGKRDNFVLDDFIACGAKAHLRRAKVIQVLEQVMDSVRKWPDIATKAGVAEDRTVAIQNTHRFFD